MNYNDFLKNKILNYPDSGFRVRESKLNSNLFDFQAAVTKWALRKGRAAIFADCGLGKTAMQLEWANQILRRENKSILILAPLAVSYQTQKEGEKFGIECKIIESQTDVNKPGIYITNYEKLHKIDPNEYVGIVADESSILKSYTGKTKRQILESFKRTKYKLPCTATPSPNDHMEILNHAEFLNVMKSNEALAIWFINDRMHAGNCRLKKHAVKDFWQWVASWAVSFSLPSDLGFEDGDFILPPLNIIEDNIFVDTTKNSGKGRLFRIPEMSATDFHKEKRLTNKDRAKHIAKIVTKKSDTIFCIWCDTNYEADELVKLLPSAVEVRGSDTIKKKEQSAIDFINGNIRVLISKPKIFGFGLNFQICNNVIFNGLSYSYESFYQATRRFWRFGQDKEVNVRIVIGQTEKQILNVIRQKEEKYNELKTNMQAQIGIFQNLKGEKKYVMDLETKEESADDWQMILGDAIEETKKLDEDSMDFEIFSPPFSQVYIYSESYRDLGNCFDHKHFFEHFDYAIPEFYRVLKPGRLCAVHCKQLVKYQGRDGVAGWYDFRGDIIRHFEKAGFQYHSEIVIWKDPVMEMYRTKRHALLYSAMRKDSSRAGQGIPDYLLLFRKWPEENEETTSVTHTKENFPLELWEKYASPVWFDIQQTKCLNKQMARSTEDEKHICPLQLEVIERAIELWTNPGDIVFSPFAGIGSEGYQALLMGRKFVGIELKPEYFNHAIKYLKSAINERRRKNKGLLSEIKTKKRKRERGN